MKEKIGLQARFARKNMSKSIAHSKKNDQWRHIRMHWSFNLEWAIDLLVIFACALLLTNPKST
jgi:hypothetical protein